MLSVLRAMIRLRGVWLSPVDAKHASKACFTFYLQRENTQEATGLKMCKLTPLRRWEFFSSNLVSVRVSYICSPWLTHNRSSRSHSLVSPLLQMWLKLEGERRVSLQNWRNHGGDHLHPARGHQPGDPNWPFLDHWGTQTAVRVRVCSEQEKQGGNACF